MTSKNIYWAPLALGVVASFFGFMHHNEVFTIFGVTLMILSGVAFWSKSSS